MFGEYGVYYEGKMIALVSDDQLFVKPSESGRTFIGDPEEAPPYPGAKNWFYISEEKWEDASWLQKLILVTAPEVALPVKKKPKKQTQ